MNRISAVVSVLLLSLGLGWRLFLAPAMTELDRVDAEQASLRSQITAASATSNQLERMRERFNGQRMAYQAIAKRLPSNAPIRELLPAITALSERHALDLRGLAPGPVQQPAFFHQQALAIDVQGRWHGLTAFIEALSSQAPLLSINDLRWQSTQPTNAPRQRLQLTLQTYWHEQSAGDAMPAQPSVPIQRFSEPNPFATPAQRQPTPLAQGWQFQGRIRVDGAIWALLRQADGRVVRRRIGERLPGTQAQIADITAERITLEPISGD